MPDVEHTSPDKGATVSTTEARQGRRGKHALWILVISMGLIVVIYAVMVGGVFGGRLSQPGGQTVTSRGALQQSGGFNTPVEAARQNERSPTVSPSVQPSAGRDQTPTAQ